MDDDVVFFVGIAVGICVGVLVVFIILPGEEPLRREAIEHRAALWEIDATTGEKSFVWDGCGAGTIDEAPSRGGKGER